MSKDGHAREVWVTMTAIRDTTAPPVAVLTTEQDLTALAAGRSSTDYLAAIINTVADAVITIDEHGAIDVFNPAAERLFGYTAAEAAGMNVRRLMPARDGHAHDDYIQRYVRTGVPHIMGATTEVTGMRQDGTTFPAHLTVGEIEHLRRFVGVLHDLRGRRALEWSLADSQVDERRHMARELQEGIGGQMTGIGLLAQTLQTHSVPAAGRPT